MVTEVCKTLMDKFCDLSIRCFITAHNSFAYSEDEKKLRHRRTNNNYCSIIDCGDMKYRATRNNHKNVRNVLRPQFDEGKENCLSWEIRRRKR